MDTFEKALGAKIEGKRLDVFVLLLLLFFASLYAYLTKDIYIGKALIVGAVFTVPPTIYLSLRKKKNWRKILVSAVVFGGLLAFTFDFIAEYTPTWTVVSLIFPKILGVEPIDNILGYMLMTVLTVVFYEHFVDRDINHHLSKHLRYAVLPSLFTIITLIVIYLFNPALLYTRYPYLYMGVAAITPTILLGFYKPNLVKKMAMTAIYFFVFYFVYEMFAVSYEWWVYKGNNYVGWVTFLGITFPFEELFFWMMFYSATLVAYYELFIDDEK